MKSQIIINNIFFSWFLLISLGIIWGMSFLGVELALKNFQPMTIACFRITLASLILFFICNLTGNKLPRPSDPHGKKILLHCLGFGLFSNAIPFSLLSWGQIQVSSSFAGIAMAVVPLVVLPMSHFLVPNQKMTALKLIGFVIGFIGIIVLIGPSAFEITNNKTIILSQVACVLASVCYATGSIITKLTPPTNLISFTSCSLLFASAIMIPLAFIFDGIPSFNLDISFLGLIYLGLFPTALATIMLVTLIRIKGPPFLSLVNYQVPIWALIFGLFILNEQLPAEFVIALVIILTGLVVSQIKKDKTIS